MMLFTTYQTKRSILKYNVLVFLITMLAPFFSANASYDVEIDGIYYNLIGLRAEVTSGPQKYQQKHIVIPAYFEYEGLPYDVRFIGEDAFRGCRNLESVELPNSLWEIGKGAFAELSFMKTIKIPNSVTTIGESAFEGCSITSIEFPNPIGKLYRIEKNAFKLSWLRSVNLPNGVSSIKDGAFSICSELTDVVLPEGLSNIDREVFSGCFELKNVSLPESLTGISEEAFFACHNLKESTFPANLFSIGLDAFSMTDLEIINCLPFDPPIIRHADGMRWGFTFSDFTYENATVYVPNEYLDIYLNEVDWGKDGSNSVFKYPYFHHIVGKDFSRVEEIPLSTLTETHFPQYVYNLQGSIIGQVESFEDIKNLTPGLYFIAGKKILVK